MIRDDGLPCEIVSGGGTGTYDISGRVEGITEIQAGSYVLMDTAYKKLDIPFEHAFTVLGTVVSRPNDAMCVTDSGHKACTQDHGNPDVKGIVGASVLFLSDEHASIMLPTDAKHAVGDRIELASLAHRPDDQPARRLLRRRRRSRRRCLAHHRPRLRRAADLAEAGRRLVQTVIGPVRVH